MSAEYDGPQVVGLDLHRNRTVMVRMTPSGDVLESVRFANDAVVLAQQIGKAGRSPEVVLEATNGWYWAVDALQGVGASVHLAHPLGVKGFAYRRVKNDYRDAADLADLLRMGRLPEAWIATTQVRDRRELVRAPPQVCSDAHLSEGSGACGARQTGRHGCRLRSVWNHRQEAAGIHGVTGALPRPGRLSAADD